MLKCASNFQIKAIAKKPKPWIKTSSKLEEFQGRLSPRCPDTFATAQPDNAGFSPLHAIYTANNVYYLSLSVTDQNKVLYGGLRAHNRWMPIMLMKYCRNIVTHAICCDKKRYLHAVSENVFVQDSG